jgi:transketolase
MKMLHQAGSGHPGASLSAADIVAALFFRVMKHDPRKPDWEERDRFFLSKGHAAPVLYAALALSGYIDRMELKSLRKLNSRLQGHPSKKCPGVEVGTGSLGQGFSMAVGAAWGLRHDRRKSHVFALLGDGECNEGLVWEAALFASHHRLGNITAIVDANGYTNDGRLEKIMAMEPFAAKWRSFGWETTRIDGHDMKQILGSLETRSVNDLPRCILAATVKGKGVAYLEGDKSFHTKGPTRQQFEQAMRDLGCDAAGRRD